MAKAGKARDSITGFGTIIGESTGKVLDFRVKSTRCRKCDCAVSDSTTSYHDCRRNHSGSSKSMEPEIAVVCFNNAPNHGIKYSSYTGDEDATTESHIKYRVNYDTAKKTDKNHATRTLGSRLYGAQNTVKGLTFVVINYILKLFSYCVLQNQGKPEKLKQGMKSLVCHAFGEHGECDATWCGALKDPSNYQYKDLPGGKQLSDDNLRAAIENAIKPFQTDEWCEKLANCGSSQANECVNGVVATKAPKIRHYGSSESLNFRVASGVCQFNEGHEYLIQTTKHLGLEESKLTTVYVETETRKRKKEQERKKKRSVKRRRKELKKAKARKKERMAGKEGTTYKSGIGVTEEGKAVTKAIIDGLLKSVSKEELEKISSVIDLQGPSPKEKTLELNNALKCFCFDLETTGLKRDSEIIQIACASIQDNEDYSNTYAVPDGDVSLHASKVNKLSTSYSSGKKVLLKDNKVVASDLSCEDALTNFVSFLENMSKNCGGSKIVLIAHNGDAFDFPVLVNSLTKFSLLDKVKALDLLFLDSLKLFSSLQVFKEMKGKTKSLSLPCIYNCLFGEDFDAHDALGDCQALSEVFLAVVPDMSVSEFAALMHTVGEVESTAKLRTTIRSRMISMQDLPLSRTMKEKIAKAGMGLQQLKTVFSTNGSKGLMALLAMPAKEKVLTTEKASPRVTNNRKILGKILAFFEGKR